MLEAKLKQLLISARESQKVSETDDHRRLQDECAVWTQLTTTGLPPPPQKHSITTLYEFAIEMQLTKTKQQNNSAGGDTSMDDEPDVALRGLVSTLEVWSPR